MIDYGTIEYDGKLAQDIFSKDVYGLDLRSYGIQLMDAVKGKVKLHTGELSDVFQPYSCPFSAAGTVALGEWTMEPAAIKVNFEACYDEFWSNFLVEQTSITLNGGIPQTFADWFFGKLREKMNKEYQEIFWKGDTARTASTQTYLKVVDGVEKQLTSNTAVTSISGAVVTVDNVLGQVEAVIQSGLSVAASTEAPTDNYKVLMNYADVQVLRMALGKVCCPNSQSIFSNYAQGANGEIYIYGFQVVPTMQSRNLILFGPSNNLILGFDTYDSHLEYRLIDMRQTTGANMFRILAITNIAVGIVFPELFVYSKP